MAAAAAAKGGAGRTKSAEESPEYTFEANLDNIELCDPAWPRRHGSTGPTFCPLRGEKNNPSFPEVLLVVYDIDI